MSRTGAWHVVAGLCLVAFLGCADGPCRELRHPELASQQPIATPAVTPVATPVANQNENSVKSEATVLVYKADGSLQCSKTKGVTPEDMEKRELSGIKVLSRDHRKDGLIHIQVCGTPTGMVNIFEISSSALKNVEARGFKKFEAR